RAVEVRQALIGRGARRVAIRGFHARAPAGFAGVRAARGIGAGRAHSADAVARDARLRDAEVRRAGSRLTSFFRTREFIGRAIRNSRNARLLNVARTRSQTAHWCDVHVAELAADDRFARVGGARIFGCAKTWIGRAKLAVAAGVALVVFGASDVIV